MYGCLQNASSENGLTSCLTVGYVMVYSPWQEHHPALSLNRNRPSLSAGVVTDVRGTHDYRLAQARVWLEQ